MEKQAEFVEQIGPFFELWRSRIMQSPGLFIIWRGPNGIIDIYSHTETRRAGESEEFNVKTGEKKIDRDTPSGVDAAGTAVTVQGHETAN